MTTLRRKADWKSVAAALRQAPGLWHRLPEGHPRVNPSRLRAGLYLDLPAGHYEARIRTDGRQWMRYVGVPVDFMELALDPERAVRRVPELGGIATFPAEPEPAGAPDLVAETPPSEDDADVARGIAGGSWHRVAAFLRDHPDEWCEVVDRPASNASAINSGRLVAFRPAGAFEARQRGAALHARYLSGPDA